ncbi:MAG TPA: carboxypeptidase M32 [Verrucomicrobiae bacterium]|nr:carboxypeptidase M32 [Verrucomicrobiae bacterium]
MDHTFPAYHKLLKRSHEIALLDSAYNTLSWDQETYMPAKALAHRADQLAWLSGESHRLFTASKVGDWIAECEQHGFASGSDEAANVREWRRSYDRKTKIPARLVEKFERVRSHAREAWGEGRKQSKFNIFRPHLQKLLDLHLQFADLWGYTGSPYNAHLDEYEPGARAGELQDLFAKLRSEIVAILGPARERSAAVPRSILHGHYPMAAQQAFNREVAQAMGFDFHAGRIDTTTHPFCSGLGPDDCRLTTRYNEQDFTQSLYGIMHETGHGLYDQGLPKEHYGTPLGSAVSLGIHESQSRLWENHVGRSEVFWRHWHPIACKHFPELSRLTPEQITAAVNHVQPSLIRVEADQVTYDLHIILRFEIELKLIERQLAVADVPAYWNEAFEKSFGSKVDKDANGCLQDIHWSIGTIGYFPTYSLGNLNAAQFMRRALTDHPALEAELAQGEYGTLLNWLREKVHRQGMKHQPQDLMRLATGESTNSTAHLTALRKKYHLPLDRRGA